MEKSITTINQSVYTTLDVELFKKLLIKLQGTNQKNEFPAGVSAHSKSLGAGFHGCTYKLQVVRKYVIPMTLSTATYCSSKV